MSESKVVIQRKSNATDIAYTIISAVLGVATVYITLRVIIGPDGTRTVNMRIAKSVEEFAQRQAEGWAHIADKAAKFYNKSRNVTV